MVSVGQKVLPGDPLVKRGDAGFKNLDLANLLKIKPQKIKNLLVKKIGDEVKAGEVIAKKTGLLANLKLKSPINGILETLDMETGILTIKTLGEEIILKAGIAGKVKEVKEGEEITLEIEGLEIEAKLGIGPKRESQLAVLKIPQVDLGALSLDLAEKIVAAKSWGLGSVSKAGALGIEGLLGEEFADEDFLKAGQGKTLPSLGLKDRGLVLLVFSPEDFAKVLKYDGHYVSAWGDEKRLLIANS